jgi:hypothetical protein
MWLLRHLDAWYRRRLGNRFRLGVGILLRNGESHMKVLGVPVGKLRPLGRGACYNDFLGLVVLVAAVVKEVEFGCFA